MKKCREREYRRTFPEAGKMAKQGRCPTKPASRGKSASQLNANGQPSNGPTKPEQDEGFSNDGQVHSDVRDDLQGRYGRIRDLKGARSGFGEEQETGLNEREGIR